MDRIVKSWKSSVIGIVALVGLSYKIYTSGGLSVEDFLLLVVGVGFIGYHKEDEVEVKNSTEDPVRDYPEDRG